MQPLIWQLPIHIATHIVLPNDEVHVWCANLAQSNSTRQQLAQTLSTDELERAERFHFQHHKNHFIVGRGLLRTILSRYLSIQPNQVQFRYEPRGKPVLAECGSGTLQFNLSHSQGLVLYAIACKRQIGIDIEYLRPIPDAEQIAQSFFSSREYEVIRHLPPNQKQLGFFNCWTRKEAYIKAIGDGLAYPLNQIEVTLAPGEPAQLLSLAGNPEAAKRWTLQELTPESDYVAALAGEGSGWKLKCWRC